MLSEIYYLEMMARERHRAFESEAHKHRLIRQSGKAHRFQAAVLFDGLADVLIRAGGWIRRHYGSPVTSADRRCP